ncbi:MAG: hypothetical protein PHU25_16375 [Deltaproteobacteria bacterium]|nr:hypothetical protein [Deltaproteobacteria bacterium]
MKIGKVNGGRTSTKSVSGRRETAPTKGAAAPPPVDQVDVVSLSTTSVAAVQTAPVDAVQPVETSTEGPLPDPLQTSKAIIEKELEIIFHEIYL